MPGSPLQHAMDLPGAGERGAECIQAEFAVDVLAHRVVDAGDHARYIEDLAGEVVTEPVERPAVAVDDGDPVAGFGKGDRGHGAHPAAANDDELHELKPHSRAYRPSASRAASTSGSPAARILAWVVAMS